MLPELWLTTATGAREQQINTDGEASESNVVSLTSSSSPSEASGRSIPNTPLTSDYRYLHWPAWPIYHALVEHGLMFDTDCPAATSEGVPTVQYLSLPVSLRPSPLQLAQSHPRWIDRFPFPRLRDNMILLRALVDLHEFVGDLFSFPGLTRCESGPTWEPAVWRMSNDFAAKWGYLFR